jgi:Flp pilus assembly protein TadD
VQQEHADDFIANMSLADALRSRDASESIRYYQAALAIRPRAIPACNNLAVALAGLGRTEEAEIHFRDALEVDPRSARVRYNLGLLLLAAKRIEPAIAELRQATTNEPSFAAAWGGLGRAHLEKEQRAEAETALAKCLELMPADDPERGAIGELAERCRGLKASPK